MQQPKVFCACYWFCFLAPSLLGLSVSAHAALIMSTFHRQRRWHATALEPLFNCLVGAFSLSIVLFLFWFFSRKFFCSFYHVFLIFPPHRPCFRFAAVFCFAFAFLEYQIATVERQNLAFLDLAVSCAAATHVAALIVIMCVNWQRLLFTSSSSSRFRHRYHTPLNDILLHVLLCAVSFVPCDCCVTPKPVAPDILCFDVWLRFNVWKETTRTMRNERRKNANRFCFY